MSFVRIYGKFSFEYLMESHHAMKLDSSGVKQSWVQPADSSLHSYIAQNW